MDIKIDWEKVNNLLPVIVQDADSNQVLMLAYMNVQAFKMSQKTSLAHYFSRTKGRIWKKGESSGNIQKIKSMYLDCDNDTLLIKVEQVGGLACHTGRKSCFFKNLNTLKDEEAVQEDLNYGVLDRLYHTIKERENEDPKTSYVAKLLQGEENSLLKKVIEEAGEFCFALKDKDEKEIVYEAADLVFHTLVALQSQKIHYELVKQELKRRFGVSGIEEKKQRDVK